MNCVIKSTKFKKTLLSSALVAMFGTTGMASAGVYTFDMSGLFTLLGSSSNTVIENVSSPYYDDPTWGYGLRTPFRGTLSYDTGAQNGSATIVPFQFFNNDSGFPLTPSGITFQMIGNGSGGAGTLALGNMLVDWNGINGIPVSIILDAQGMIGALNAAGVAGLGVGSVVDGTYGTTGASDLALSGSIQMGKLAIATTTWNTTGIPPCIGINGVGCMGTNPSGGLPLVADSVGGSPLTDGPFPGFNGNFDVQTLTLTSYVPEPATFALFGIGLAGLGWARRKAA